MTEMYDLIVNGLCLLAVAVSAMFSWERQAQLLQQNSYYASRYCKWLAHSSKLSDKLLPAVYLLFTISPVFSVGRWLFQPPVAAALLLLRILIAVKQRRASIKKLVYTARVKRLFATSSVLLIIPAVLMLLFGGAVFYTAAAVFAVLSAACPVLVLLALAVNAPMEKLITQWYINDAKRILSSSNAKVIGITGSYGKTGTKFILGRILAEKYNVVVTPESFNTPMGVVRTIREKINASTQVFVAEMGARNIGDIKEICNIIHPAAGIITSVGPQHLETFKTVENVAKTKLELADEVNKNGGEIVLNYDSSPLKAHSGGYRKRTYGTGDGNDITVRNVSVGRDGSEFDVCSDKGVLHLNSKLLGTHNVLNIAGAVAVALDMGVPEQRIAYAVRRLEPVEHRLELKPFINGSLMLDDAYNSNPEGCIEAVNVLSRFDGMKKIIVTPGLVELGELEEQANYNLAAAAADCCDFMIFVGKVRSEPMLRAAKDKKFDEDRIRVTETFAQAMEILKNEAGRDSVVLVENDLPDVYK